MVAYGPESFKTKGSVGVSAFIPSSGNFPGTMYGGGLYVLTNGSVVTQKQLQDAGAQIITSPGGNGRVQGNLDASKLPGYVAPAPAPAPAQTPAPAAAPPPQAPQTIFGTPSSGQTRPVAPTPQQTAPIKEDSNVQAAGIQAVTDIQKSNGSTQNIKTAPESLTGLAENQLLSIFEDEETKKKKTDSNIGYKTLLGE